MADKKILMVLPPTRFDGRTYETARRIWEMGGNKVSVASVARGGVNSADGISARVDVLFENVKSWDYDAFVFVGCEDISLLIGDGSVRKLADDAKFKVVASTGNAILILALADLLKEKRATGPYEYAQHVIRHGGRFTSTPFEIDGKVVTLQDPNVVEQFANAVLRATE
jgi:putative intracellular protease/amidase